MLQLRQVAAKIKIVINYIFVSEINSCDLAPCVINKAVQSSTSHKLTTYRNQPLPQFVIYNATESTVVKAAGGKSPATPAASTPAPTREQNVAALEESYVVARRGQKPRR